MTCCSGTASLRPFRLTDPPGDVAALFCTFRCFWYCRSCSFCTGDMLYAWLSDLLRWFFFAKLGLSTHTGQCESINTA